MSAKNSAYFDYTEEVLKSVEKANRFKQTEEIDDDDDFNVDVDDANERDDTFNIDSDLRKSTDNLKIKTALNFYEKSPNKEAILDKLSLDIVNVLLSEEFRTNSLALVDPNWNNT